MTECVYGYAVHRMKCARDFYGRYECVVNGSTGRCFPAVASEEGDPRGMPIR